MASRADKKRDGTTLGEYERKRDFGVTEEPAPKKRRGDLATGQRRPVVGGSPAFPAAGDRFGALDVEELGVLLVSDHQLQHRQVEVAFGLFTPLPPGHRLAAWARRCEGRSSGSRAISEPSKLMRKRSIAAASSPPTPPTCSTTTASGPRSIASSTEGLQLDIRSGAHALVLGVQHRVLARPRPSGTSDVLCLEVVEDRPRRSSETLRRGPDCQRRVS